LQKGTVIEEKKDGVPFQTVLRQKPEAKTKIREGDIVDLWISGTATNPE
jgi:beta-lactam-binding protein with PASTA domain